MGLAVVGIVALRPKAVPLNEKKVSVTGVGFKSVLQKQRKLL